MLIICAFADRRGDGLLGWLLATFAVRPFRRLAAADPRRSTPATWHPTSTSAGPPRPSRSARRVKGLLQRIWAEQDRTKAALTSARDFAAVSAHELRTPLTAMRTNLEVLATLDMPDEQRKEVLGDVIRTQTRIEATLGALERLAQGELSTAADQVPVDITELLDRAAHDAMRVYPGLEVSLAPSPTCIIIGLPAGLRLAVDNAIANAVKHGGATRVQLSAVSSRDGRGDRRRRRRHRGTRGGARQRSSSGSPAGRRRRTPAPGSAWRWSPSRPNSTAAQRRWRTARWAARGCCCGCRRRASGSFPSRQ